MSQKRHEIPPDRRRQFDLIVSARAQLLAWARAEGFPLEHVEYVVPFVPTDFSCYAWIFYPTEHDIPRLRDDGTSAKVERQLQALLASAGYPADWLAGLAFQYASKQEVERSAQGSYSLFVR